MLKNLTAKPLLTVCLALLLALASWLGTGTAAISLPQNQPLMAFFSLAGSRPANLGIQDSKFAACASTSNCVSSQATDPKHRIDPIRYSSTPQKAFSDLKQAILDFPRTAIITETETYLYAEFTSKLMGFVDDVEFYLNRDSGLIEVRSASRLGESDWGANRQRIEALRTTLKDLGNTAS